MTNRNTILNELTGLGPTLAGHNPQNIYTVPDGYFEGLANQILNRIKALEATDVKAEIGYLSPMLSVVSKEMPYSVPVGYFGNLDETILQRIREHADYQTSEEEIESLSPMLSGLRNKNPFSVPAGYFENLRSGVEKHETKVISITRRKWFRLAVAAVIIGVIIIGGILFFNSGKVDPNKNPEEWIAKNVKKKVSTEKIDEFVALAKEDDSMKPVDQNISEKTDEIKELMKDVPEKDITEFLNDAVALESNTDASMNE